jgi:uncharacterized protein (DUF885 family)
MKRSFALIIALLSCLPFFSTPAAPSAQTATLQKLSADFWSWRARTAPFTGDDVNRIDRPGGTRDWSAAAIAQRKTQLAEFETKWKALDATGWTVPDQVDYRLLGSALARLHWELEINPRWKRDPTFYIEQTLTPVVEALAVPGPYNEPRSRELLVRLQNIPSILQAAQANLVSPPAPFASVAIEGLKDIGDRLHKMATALQPATTLKPTELAGAVDLAVEALDKYRAALETMLPSLPAQTALGREAYEFFLRNVALLPYSPEQLLAMGRQEWDRAVTFEAFERQRNSALPPLSLARDISSWQKDAAVKELAIRDFLEKHDILTVPAWVQHYTLRPMPEYLHALEGFGEMDDFTSPARLQDDCVRYMDAPSPQAGYFDRATAADPRPLTVHEGIPGHYFQLCLSWKQENPIRRHYYDSGANEGIGFYAEEMMLQAGLFDDSPHTREIIYNFMRLRALRVEVDVRLALGEFTLEQAAKYLEQRVPMDPRTARGEAIAFSTGPGQAITYQIGKLQITRLLAEARMRDGEKFSLRAFHDFVWKNGNVPIALQRWEYLGKSDLPPLPPR